MKAKIKALVTLLVLCVFLALTFALLPPGANAPERPGSASAGPTESAAFPLTNIPVSEIQALAISNIHGSYGIINSPDGITAVSDTGVNFSVQEMRALVYLAGHLTATRHLDTFLPKAEDIANSLARFTLILSGGRENNFAILRKSPVSDEYLLFFEEQQSVFLVSAADAEWFLRSAAEFPAQ